MTRLLAPYVPAKHGKISMGGEPLVFHCNFYNYFLQKTLLLDDTLGMEAVIHDAALSSAFALLTRAGRELGRSTPAGGLPKTPSRSSASGSWISPASNRMAVRP